MKINTDFIKLCKALITENEVMINKDIDWKSMCKMALEEKLLPLFLNMYQKNIPDKILFNFVIDENKTYIKNKHIVDVIEYLTEKIGYQMLVGKGCSFSQYLYSDPLIRVCKDVDFFVKNEHQFQICKAMESLGYREAHYAGKKKINTQELHDFYASPFEKAFIKEGSPYIEIKSSALLFEKSICKNGIENYVTFENYPNIKTFNIFYTFLLLNANIYINYFSSWGISAECKFRDLVDLCKFYFKYGSSLKESDYCEIENITFPDLSYNMKDIISANCNLISYVFDGSFVGKYIPDFFQGDTVWPENIDANQIIFNERDDRWENYSEAKNKNSDSFVKYKTVFLPVRMEKYK